MQKLIILAALFMVVAIVLAALRAGLVESRGTRDAYYLRKSLVTSAEHSFLGVLESVLPPGTRVFGKVGLDALLGVKGGLERDERQAALNHIARKHVDFVLVRASDLTPLAGIEIDDSSPDDEDPQQRDAFVDLAFEKVGLPLLHFPAQQSYNPSELKAILAVVLPQV